MSKKVYVKPYPKEFREQVVKLVQLGDRSALEVAREFEISVDSVRRWVQQAERDQGRRQDGLSSPEREELVRLRREIRRLRMEREEREAQVELRWREVELADPDRQEAALKLRLVHVREQTQPEGAERLEWFLLTTLAVQTQPEAERVLEWYKLRWRIEDWYRVLKSGCKVEYLGHRQGERIERAVTINAVIAWWLTLMTLLGRDTPELPADTLFTEIELAALEDFAQDRRQLPPDNLGRAVLTLAMLGGYLNYKRKQYAVPGHKVMWEGYTRLATITQVVERTRRLNEGSKLYQKMRRE